MNSFFKILTNIIAKFSWLVISMWVLILSVSIFFAMQLTPLLSGGGWDVKGSQSYNTQQLLAEDFLGRGNTTLTLVVEDKENNAESESHLENINNIIEFVENNNILSTNNIYSLLNAPDEAAEGLIGENEHTSLIFIAFDEDEGFARNKIPNFQDELNTLNTNDLNVYVVGASSFWGEINVLSQKGLAQAELIALPLILIILLWVFRSIISAITPLLVAVSSVITTLGIMTLIAQNVELSIFVTNAAIMLGLGIGVDYSLFIVNRYREELSKEIDKKTALFNTLKTAGDAVFFSGLTIIVCMSVLFIVDLNVIKSIALGAIVIVSVTLLISLSLLPSVLYVLGNKINSGSFKFIPTNRSNSNFWYKWSFKVMKRPFIFLGLSLVILALLTIPTKDLSTFTPDASILPDDSNSRIGYEIIQSEFSEGSTSPIYLAIKSETSINSPNNLNYIQTVSNEINSYGDIDEVTSVTTILADQDTEQMSLILDNWNDIPQENQNLLNRYVNSNLDIAIIEVIPAYTAASNQTRDLVEAITQDYIIKNEVLPNELSIFIGGETVEGIDSNQVIEDKFVTVISLMLILGYLILFLTFKSVLLPLKAILMNLVSLGATYGILVVVFQYGFGSDLLGFTPANYVQNFVPILLLALLFSLSTDYEVFLLSRVKEEYRITRDNNLSVARGLQATAPMISGAAVLMVTVFSAFAFTGILPIQQLGLGMAVAIAIDATIIRLVVVPASMKLMGKWNWWLPFKRK